MPESEQYREVGREFGGGRNRKKTAVEIDKIEP